MADKINIGICTDTHYWPGSDKRFGAFEDNQLQPWSEQIQATLLAELQAASLDMVFHLGDFTCGGGHYQMPEPVFRSVLTTTCRQFEALPIPFHGLPGNHDCPTDGGNWSLAEELLGLEPGLGKTIDLPFVRLVLLNAQGHSAEQIEATRPNDPVYGWVNQAEQQRFREVLATAGQRPVIVFIHQLLKYWVGQPEGVDFFQVKNAAEVLEIMAEYTNVRAVFQGHAHGVNVRREQVGSSECTFVVIPSTTTYPLAWLHLALTPQQARATLRRLPLPDLAEISRKSGEGSPYLEGFDWRIGRPEWHDLRIELLAGENDG